MYIHNKCSVRNNTSIPQNLASCDSHFISALHRGGRLRTETGVPHDTKGVLLSCSRARPADQTSEGKPTGRALLSRSARPVINVMSDACACPTMTSCEKCVIVRFLGVHCVVGRWTRSAL